MKVGYALSALLHLILFGGLLFLPSVFGAPPPRPINMVKLYAGEPNASDPHPGIAGPETGHLGGEQATPKPTPPPKATPKATPKAAPTPKAVVTPKAAPTAIPLPDPNAKPLQLTREKAPRATRKVEKVELKREEPAAGTREVLQKPIPQPGPGAGPEPLPGGTGVTQNGLGLRSATDKPLDPNFVYGKGQFFIAMLVEKLTQAFMPPRAPEEVLAKREALIGFVIEPDGRIVNVAVNRSSGSEDFDKAAMDAVQAISPLEGGLPEELRGGPILVTAPFRGAPETTQ